jgi:hypothetical protein
MSKLLLWCSPGFGMVDMWLPVIKKLKEKNGVTVDFIFPEPSSLRLECNKSDLFNLSEKFSDKVVYRGYSGRWFVADTLIKASKSIKFSELDEKISRLANRLLIGRLSKYGFLRKMGKYTHLVHRHIIRIKEDIGGVEFYDINLLNNARGILCDITVEGKIANKELKNELVNIQKFSMNHGTGATWYMDRFDCEKIAKKRQDTIVYTASNLENPAYNKCFGISDDNIINAGIPSHDNDWIEFICKRPGFSEDSTFGEFVFIIGRPASPYNTYKRKKKALVNIYNNICIKHKLKIIVKTHPKESINGIDGDMYKDVLGIENYGKIWMYSDKHPFILGKKAVFSISFYSGVALGLLSIKKPTIEYLDLRGIEAYDNKHSLRDKSDTPVFSDRYANLVLGASNKLEFEKHVDSILNRCEETVLPLYSKYKDYFDPLNNASKIVANDIYTRIK